MKPDYYVLRDSGVDFNVEVEVVDIFPRHSNAKIEAENLTRQTGLPHVVVKSTVSYQVPKPDLIVTEYDEF